jgi:carbon storage regulator
MKAQTIIIGDNILLTLQGITPEYARFTVSRAQGSTNEIYALLAGQEAEIAPGVTLKLLTLKKHQVRIGIAAPRRVAVHREEIYNKIKAGVPCQQVRTPTEIIDLIDKPVKKTTITYKGKRR